MKNFLIYILINVSADNNIKNDSKTDKNKIYYIKIKAIF